MAGGRHEPFFPAGATNRPWDPLGEGDYIQLLECFVVGHMSDLKVVFRALLCRTLVLGIGVAALASPMAPATERSKVTVVKASKPMTASTSEDRTIR